VVPAPAKEVEQEPKTEIVKSDVDLSALADAVAMHETGYCTSPGSPTANARNNCWGIMRWYYDAAGVKQRTLRTFKTKEEGKAAFIANWQRGYGGRMPTLKDAQVYSGNDMAATWHANVHKFYAQKLAE
jgi:hypothetical protein